MTQGTVGTRPTLADVATEAGVSAVTVSRVIKGSDSVADRTRERVMDAMHRLGYFGNAAATQLVSGETRIIGVLTSTISAYGYAQAIEGIEECARERGYSVLISVLETDDGRTPREAVAQVAAQALAGVIVLDFDVNAVPFIEALPPYLPVIALSGPDRAAASRVPIAFLDDVSGGREATEYLIGLGHTSVFALGPPNTDTGETRTRGVAEALEAAGLPMFPVIVCADWSPQAGFDAMTTTLERYGPLVTAILCANDEVALGAIRAIRNAGLSVPGDVSVVGFDDNPLAPHTIPPLTTVHQDFVQLGRDAFDLMEQVMRREQVNEPVGGYSQLVIRESTAAPNPKRGLRLP